MRRKTWLVLGLIWLLMMPDGRAGVTDAAPRKLTLMIYMCGSNLESGFGSASTDIREMLANPPEDRGVTVLVMTGGTAKWNLGFDAEKTMIHEIGSRGMRTVWPSSEDNAEAMNMGDPATLAFFLTYGVNNFPAQDYALILWDHGGGPMSGVCWDEMFSMDNLSLNDVSKAIDQSAIRKTKLSWIGFDACLMGSLEVACTMAAHADYMIASQETEPAMGWNYAFLRDLGQDRDGAETGRRIVDAYFDGAGDTRESLTLSCLNLQRMDALRQAMNSFFSPLAQQVDETTFPGLSGLRLLSAGFGKADVGSGDNDYDLVDLADLISRLDPDHSEKLRKAMSDAVVYSRTNMEGAGGLSVYHPYHNKRKYVESWHNSYLQIKSSPRYADYIFRFGALLTAGEMVDWSGLKAVYEGDGIYSCALTADQAAHFVSARLLILQPNISNNGVDDSYTLIGDYPAVLDENGNVRAEYRGRTLYAVTPAEDTNYVTGPLTYYQASSLNLGVLPGLYQPRETAVLEGMQQAVILFEIPTLTEETEAPIHLVRLHDSATGTFSSRLDFRPEDYSELWFKSIQQGVPGNNENGTLPAYREWPDYDGRVYWQGLNLDEAWYLYFFDHQLTGDRLMALFEITDAQQNAFCSAMTQVEHPGITEISVISDPIETDVMRVELSGDITDTELDQVLSLHFRLTNRTEEKIKCMVRGLTLNGSRSVSGTAYETLDAGETKTSTVQISARMLEGLKEIVSVEGEMTVEQDSSDGKITEEIRFILLDADVSGIAPAMPVLAETEAEGITWRLLDISPGNDGDLDLRLQVVNSTADDLKFDSRTVIAINRIQTDTFLRETIPAGGEKIVSFTVKDAVLLESLDRIRVQNLVDFLRPLVLSQRVLARHGQSRVEELTIGIYDYYLKGLTAELHLDSPVEIPVFIPQSQNSRWYGALPDARSEEIRTLTLMDWPQAGVWAERILVGDNGFAAVLDIENRTDQPLELRCRLKEINQIQVKDTSVDEVFLVMPGCTLTATMPVELKKDLADIKTISNVAFELAGLPGLTDPLIRVNFSRPASLGVSGGVTLESGDMQADMPAAPVQYESSVPTGVRYHVVEIMYEDWEWGEEWLDYSDTDCYVTLYPDSSAEVTWYGNGQSDWIWAANEDGSVNLGRYRGIDHYIMYMKDGHVYMHEEGFARFRLEPAE